MKKYTLNTWLEKEQYETIKREAKKQDMSCSTFIRRIVMEYIKKVNKKGDRDE